MYAGKNINKSKNNKQKHIILKNPTATHPSNTMSMFTEEERKMLIKKIMIEKMSLPFLDYKKVNLETEDVNKLSNIPTRN